MKKTLIVTVLNEEDTIDLLLKSLKSQSQLPEEIIFVDGGSTDHTVEKLKKYVPVFAKQKVRMKILIRSGNRSIGRNQAVRHAKGEIILCTDAGCILDEKWVENIIQPFDDNSVDVVAGFYQGRAKTPFQESVIPYVLVTHDRVNPEKFLPASRSMAFRKKMWVRVKGFPIQYSHNEDYVFAKELERKGANIMFKNDAVVYWLPRKTLREAFVMFFRFSLGDGESGQFRIKVLLIFLRYLIGVMLVFLAVILHQQVLFYLIGMLLLFYCLWAVLKNMRHVKSLEAMIYLPLLQFTADIAVLIGTTFGIMRRVWDTHAMQ